MCLAVPARVVEITPEGDDVLMGKVEIGGVRRVVCLDHVPEVKVGEFVLIHVGFALSRIDEAEATRLLDEIAAITGAGAYEDEA